MKCTTGFYGPSLGRSQFTAHVICCTPRTHSHSQSVYFWWKRRIAATESGQKRADTGALEGKTGETMVIRLPNGVECDLPVDNLALVQAVVKELAGTDYQTKPLPKKRLRSSKRSK